MIGLGFSNVLISHNDNARFKGEIIKAKNVKIRQELVSTFKCTNRKWTLLHQKCTLKSMSLFYRNYSGYSGYILKDELCNDINISHAYSWNHSFLLTNLVCFKFREKLAMVKSRKLWDQSGINFPKAYHPCSI